MRTVRDAMLRAPTLSPAGTSVREAADRLGDPHVHALLVVEGERLVCVVEAGDLDGARPDAPARDHGGLDGRTVGPDADLAPVWAAMRAQGRRRLAVVDGDRLLGLLCLKRTSRGFCSDADVAERREDPLS